jgi:hypothetical protein
MMTRLVLLFTLSIHGGIEGGWRIEDEWFERSWRSTGDARVSMMDCVLSESMMMVEMV